MPELPEVEITCRGIAPHICGKEIISVVKRTNKLRWPLPKFLKKHLTGHTISAVTRRAKYILITTTNGTLIIHLGMSGSLRITDKDTPAKKHDHVDFIFDKHILRMHDPRRFGAVLWTNKSPHSHKLIASLGPEPLSQEFSAKYLFDISRNRRVSVKEFIMNAKIVVGVGNIYATEALFNSKIHPLKAAGKISLARYTLLVESIKNVLQSAVLRGGTTLRDFTNEDGKPGYFQQELLAYGRGNQPCLVCSTPLKSVKIGQRTTTYCTHCQH